MNSHRLMFLCGVVIMAGLLVPGISATDPLWTQAGASNGELSCVVISADGSTIVAGGDQLIALSPDGKKIWTGWSGSPLAISPDGNYLVTSRDQTVRLISGTGTMLWDQSLVVPVTEVAIMPDASLVAAAGGSRLMLFNRSGAGVKLNTSISASHFRLFPDGNSLVMTTKNGVETSNLTLIPAWTDTNMSQDLVEVAADGSSFVTVTNNRVRLYTRGGTWGESLEWERALPGGNALAFAYSRDGSTIVVGRDDNTLEVLDGNGTRLWTARASYWITSVAVSDDGNTIVAGSMDKTLSVYDRAGTKLGSFTAREPIKARSVAVSGDGSVIAVVDASAVYGFSRSQFTQPVTAAVTTAAPPALLTTPAPTVPVIPSASAPGPTATPKAALPMAVPLLGLFFLCRSPKP
jgi:WD40 repeat protein